MRVISFLYIVFVNSENFVFKYLKCMFSQIKRLNHCHVQWALGHIQSSKQTMPRVQ
jgi:hypothetical protein